MITKRMIRFSITAVATVIIGVCGWFLWASDSEAKQFRLGSPEAQGVVPVFSATSVDGSVQYGYGVELPTRFAGASVEYDYQTSEGISQYVAFNRSQLDRLLRTAQGDKHFATLVTFNRPLTRAEFVDFVTRYQISVKSYIIWIDNADGTTTTIQGAPSETELIPVGRMDYVLDDVQARGGEEFLGWVEVNGTVAARDLRSLAADAQVFLADVAEAVIQEQFTDATLTQAGVPPEIRTAVLQEGFQVSRPSLAWAVRNQGLMSGIVGHE